MLNPASSALAFAIFAVGIFAILLAACIAANLIAERTLGPCARTGSDSARMPENPFVHQAQPQGTSSDGAPSLDGPWAKLKLVIFCETWCLSQLLTCTEGYALIPFNPDGRYLVSSGVAGEEGPLVAKRPFSYRKTAALREQVRMPKRDEHS